MQHFTYSYDEEHQCLIKSNTAGKEIQRMFLPASDIERICGILWLHSIAKLNLEKE